MKENLTLLYLERKQVVDREKETLKHVRPVDGSGWLMAAERLEIAKLKLKHVEKRMEPLNIKKP